MKSLKPQINRFLKSAIYLLLIVINAFLLNAKEKDKKVIKDLKEQWLTYVSDRFQPYVSTESVNEKTLSFPLYLNAFEEDSYLYINLERGGALFLDNQLCHRSKNGLNLIWPLDSLSQLFDKDTLLATVYFEEISPEDIVTEIVSFKSYRESRQDYAFMLISKQKFNGHQRFVLVLLICFVYMVLVRRLFWQEFLLMYNPSGIFSDRQDEFSERGRFMTFPNILLLGLIAFLTVLLLSYMTDYDIVDFVSIDSSSGITLNKMAIIFMVVFGLVITKYLLISIMSELYSLQSFHASQFLKGVRMVIPFLIIFIVFSMIKIWLFGDVITKNDLFWLAVLFIVVKFGILWFKLIGGTNFKKIHLFSYLCATEIMPEFWVMIYFSDRL